jgi:phage terminase large subunit-like protein
MAARFELREVRFDPCQMQALAQRLQKQSRQPLVEFPQTVSNLTEASTNLYELIKGRKLVVDPDADIRLAV